MYYVYIDMYTYIYIDTRVYVSMFLAMVKCVFGMFVPSKKMMFHVRVKFTKGYATSPEKK